MERPKRKLLNIERDLEAQFQELIQDMAADKDLFLYFTGSKEIRYKPKALKKNDNDKYYLEAEKIEEINMYDETSMVNLDILTFKTDLAKRLKRSTSYTGSNKTAVLPHKLKKLITEYKEYWEYYSDPEVEKMEQERLDGLVAHPTYDQWNNNGRVVTVRDLELQLEKVLHNEDRIDGESRAVVVDNSRLFINASAALEQTDNFDEYKKYKEDGDGAITRDPRKDGDKVYDVCEAGGGVFLGTYFTYAEAPELRAWINSLQEDEE